MEKRAIIEHVQPPPHPPSPTSCLPVCDGLQLHGCVLDHGDGASDVDQALVVGTYPGVGAPVLDVAGQ